MQEECVRGVLQGVVAVKDGFRGACYRWRPLTRAELQKFFDYADEQVEIRLGGGRKGTFSAYRDATLFKVAYAWGLRAAEVAGLDVTDFWRNPHAPEFGAYGRCWCVTAKLPKEVLQSEGRWPRSTAGRRRRCKTISRMSGLWCGLNRQTRHGLPNVAPG